MPTDDLSKKLIPACVKLHDQQNSVMAGVLASQRHRAAKPEALQPPPVKGFWAFPLLSPKACSASEIHLDSPVEKLCKSY